VIAMHVVVRCGNAKRGASLEGAQSVSTFHCVASNQRTSASAIVALLILQLTASALS
jgi:hypothetical protein